jgi:5'-nucleotidase
MTSGTAGAALEGSNQGPKGIAFSLQVEDQGDKFDDPRNHGHNFDAAKNIVRDVVSRTLSRGFCPHADIINVNIPSAVKGGYEITRLARKLFCTGVEKRFDPRGRPYFWINGPLIEDAEEGTDVHAIHKGNVSITPITLDCTAYNAEDEARTLFLE